jgi:FkbM family methyltransferase
VVIRRGMAVGMAIRTRNSNPGYALGTSEPRVQHVLGEALFPGAVCYDLGANVGFFTLIAAKAVGEEGRVYAFEPLNETAIALRENVNLNSLGQVEVVEAAVSDTVGQATLVEGPLSLNAHLKRKDESATSAHEVPATTVDAVIKDRGFLPPDVVKIDVEGEEAAVLRGMKETIRTHRPTIICEMHMTTPLDTATRAFAEEFAHSVGEDVDVEMADPASIPAVGYRVTAIEEAPPETKVWAPHILARAEPASRE